VAARQLPPDRDDEARRLVLLDEQVTLTASDAFSSQLLYRLRDGATATRGIVDWPDERLALRGSDVEEVLIAEQTRLSAGSSPSRWTSRS